LDRTSTGWIAPALFLAHSFDHLVGDGQQRERNGKTERFGGLEVDGQIDLVTCWTGKSAGFSPLRIRPM
jgi:hypothetical protein